MESYFSISLHSLSLDSVLTFDLYLNHASTGKHVLYRHRDTPFTEEVRHNLNQNDVRELHVPREQRDDYFEYASQKIRVVIQDQTLSRAEKSQAVYKTTSLIMEDLFVTPRSSIRIKQAKQAINHTVDFMLKDEESTRSLIFLTSHDYYTYTHSVNVTLFATALAQRVFASELESHDFTEIGEGFLLHDIGKSTISPSIINKPGKLNDAEWGMMRRHPEEGHRILTETSQLTGTIEKIVLQHHERMDGKGYPFGLVGSQIHPYARVCAIADVFDAITTVRSYRDPLSTFDALAVMRNDMGNHFDWDYFNEFVKLFRK
jgi:HD-GYP domain-containing protein (c-di-GMP phosphodiesterase class II)